MNFTPTKHPILVIPTAAQAAAMGEVKWKEVMKRREEIIEKEVNDPLRYGWEPPVWKLADALLDLDPDKERGKRVREALGFENPVRVLLIMGGNRGAKTEYPTKRITEQLNQKDAQDAWVFHSTHDMSVDVHHERFWHYMPPEFRHNVRGAVEYISHKQKTGFSDMKFVLRNGSAATFKHYSMEKDDALQGAEIDMFFGDELIPIDWVDDLGMRIATRSGWGIVSFTPLAGYSSTVRAFQDGATTVLASTAFLLPKDGKGPDVPRALGFESEEEMKAAHAEERWSVPSQFELVEGADEGSGERAGNCPPVLREKQPAVPEGRVFEKMPRVMKCVDPKRAILFFWSCDNPFGNPRNVIDAIGKRGEEETKRLFHGFTEKSISMSFPRFSRKTHVIPAKAIPEEGSDYMLVDPASARNWFMMWIRVTKVAAYVRREWPGSYLIPGVGVPGPWAIPDGKHMDGRRGPAQKPFGFGLARMLREIARLEGWVQKEQRFEENGARERIVQRFIDSRAASSPRVENDRPRTLQTDLDELGIHFDLTPGDEIDTGVTLITSALDWNEELPLSFDNQPKLFVSDECLNTIYALETWTGDDGQAGACKEPIDLLRYFFLADCGYVSADFWKTSGGGYY